MLLVLLLVLTLVLSLVLTLVLLLVLLAILPAGALGRGLRGHRLDGGGERRNFFKIPEVIAAVHP